jgi:hypothetical protein
VVTAIADEGTIGMTRGKARCKSPYLGMLTVSVFGTGKIQGGQDRTFLFPGGLVKYKVHYLISWFRPLLRGNSRTSSGLILKMNSGYNWGEQSA